MTSLAPCPAIALVIAASVTPSIVRAIALGCEEEGVPTTELVGSGDAVALARQGARDSALFIGVGIDSQGAIALHEHRLGEHAPLLRETGVTTAVARRIGIVAGRLARGRPLPDAVPYPETFVVEQNRS